MKSRFGVPAFVLASIALFVALSGGAVAAGIVPLARHATTAGTAANALKLGGKTPAQLRKAWIGNALKQGAGGPQGPAGQKGDIGATGARGPAGPAGPAGTAAVSVHTAPFVLAIGGGAGEKGLFTVNCGAGQKAVSGGFDADGTVLSSDDASDGGGRRLADLPRQRRFGGRAHGHRVRGLPRLSPGFAGAPGRSRRTRCRKVQAHTQKGAFG